MSVVIGALVVVVRPFAGKAASGGRGATDNGAPTALVTLQRRSLTSQTAVSGTLGYAGAWTVVVPAVTSATDLQQAGQQVTSARASYAAARTTASGDGQALATARAVLQADQLKEARDCAAANALTNAATSGGAAVTGACASSMQAVTADGAMVASAQQKVAADRPQLPIARSALANAEDALAAAQSTAAAYGASASYTGLPGAGEVLRRGHPLYAVNGSRTLLLYGATPAWRSFAAGMAPGRDVAELNANLRVLGYHASRGGSFTTATRQAIRAMQRAHGLPVTGTLPLGSVAFEPAAVRVTSVTPALGEPVQPGPIMTLSSTRHDVSLELDASQQAEVRVGDRVAVTLPDNRTTPGVVASVSRVATTAASDQSTGGGGGDGGGGSSPPTVEVHVWLRHPAAAGTLDQAPVDVLVTTASVRNVLVVPVNALLALAGGGYALEQETASGRHQLLPVTPGLFDDQAGLVQVSGTRLAAGQRVVAPGVP